MQDCRQAIVQWAEWAVANKAHFNYTEGPTRMSALGIFPPKFPINADCSAAVTLYYWLAGVALDPNGGTAWVGNQFNRQGYTGTLLNHGQHILAPVPGDLVVYGAVPGVHTAVVVWAQGPDILTVSHGQQGDPSFVWVNKPVHVPQAGHPIDGRKPQTYLRFATGGTPRFPDLHPAPVI